MVLYLSIGLSFAVYGLIYWSIYDRIKKEQQETTGALQAKITAYREKVKYNAQIRKLQHDMSNLLITVQQLLTMGQREQADQLLQQYEHTLQELERKTRKQDIPSL